MPTKHGVGKTTLTQGLGHPPSGSAQPETGGDPIVALVAKVKSLALEGHAHKALDVMATVDRPQQKAIASGIGTQARRSFAEHMPTDIGNTQPMRESSKVLFDQTPDDEFSTLEALFEARFRLHIGSHPQAEGTPRKFDAAGLRRLWTDFQKLPAGHVAKNWAVATIDRYKPKPTDDDNPTHAHGMFSYPEDGKGKIDLSYTDSIIEDGGTTDHDRPGDPLHGVNRFDEVARHEIGHAVDRELGVASYNVLGPTHEAGVWENYFDPTGYRKAAEQMVTRSNGPIHKLPASERSHVIDAMVMSMEHSDTSYFLRAIDHAHEHGDVKSDAVYHVMIKGLAKENPWLQDNTIAGRHYHQGYTGNKDLGGAGAVWVSYREEAKKNHRVSEYQFRANQEWFAEVYSAFYTPVEGKPKGSLIKQKLPETYKWFVHHVDNRHNLAKKSKQVHKDDKAPKKP